MLNEKMKNRGFKIGCVVISQLWNTFFTFICYFSIFEVVSYAFPNFEIHGSPLLESG